MLFNLLFARIKLRRIGKYGQSSTIYNNNNSARYSELRFQIGECAPIAIHSVEGVSPISFQPARKITVCDRLLFVWAQNAPHESRWSKLVIVVARAGRTHRERVEIDWRCRRLNEAHLRLFAPFNYKCLPSRSSSIIDKRTYVPAPAKKAVRIQRKLTPSRGTLQRALFGFLRPSSSSRLLICMVTLFLLGGCAPTSKVARRSECFQPRQTEQLEIQSAVRTRPKANYTCVCEHRRLQRKYISTCTMKCSSRLLRCAGVSFELGTVKLILHKQSICKLCIPMLACKFGLRGIALYLKGKIILN